ncbi:MAG: hypothetical protein ACRCX2_02040 [Paraclostridium sp.]
METVDQALGRVIRHKTNYKAIVRIDLLYKTF